MAKEFSFNRVVILAIAAASLLAPLTTFADPADVPTPPFEGCRFYQDRDFGGHHFDIDSNHDVSWIGGAWNDQISSYACSPGCNATLFEDRDFGGASVTYNRYAQYVGNFWNDRTSSIKITCLERKPHGPFTGSVPTTPMHSDRCKSGYVWREANSSDHVCVTPDSRERTRRENFVAAHRVDPNGAWGPTSCISGFVWREAFDGDHVCVTPRIREVVREENQLGPSRRE